MRKDMDEKQFQVEFYINIFLKNLKKFLQEETYIKLLPTQDDTQSVTTNGTTPGVPIDNEQLTREDLKFSVKIFLRSLEPEILKNTINTGLSVSRFNK